jgi:hypothetical protein
VHDQRSLGGGLGGPVEVLKRLVGGEGGVADPLAGAGGLAGEHLGFQQRLEKLFVGPLLGAGPLGGLLKTLPDSRGFELREQVWEPVTRLLGLGHAHKAA